MKNIKIYKAYHKPEHIELLKLKNTEHIILYNTNDLNVNGNHINQLNPFLSELCCILYPYLNNLKSDYIGFQHYKRYFDITKINEENLKIYDYQTFAKYEAPNFLSFKDMFVDPLYSKFRSKYINIDCHFYFWRMYLSDLRYDYIEFFEKYYPSYLYSELNGHLNPAAFEMFVCTWDNYCRVAQILYDYLVFINNKYNLNWEYKKWYDHVETIFIKNNRKLKIPTNTIYNHNKDVNSCWGDNNWDIAKNSNLLRIYSYIIEFMIGQIIFNYLWFIDYNAKLHIITSVKGKNI